MLAAATTYDVLIALIGSVQVVLLALIGVLLARVNRDATKTAARAAEQLAKSSQPRRSRR